MKFRIYVRLAVFFRPRDILHPPRRDEISYSRSLNERFILPSYRITRAIIIVVIFLPSLPFCILSPKAPTTRASIFVHERGFKSGQL